jgi:hypothetical protein
LAALTELGGQEAQGRTGHVDARRVDKHTKPLVEKDFLVENPSTRGFIFLSAQLPGQSGRLERAHWPYPVVTQAGTTRWRGACSFFVPRSSTHVLLDLEEHLDRRIYGRIDSLGDG